MTQKYPDGEVIYAPGTVIISAVGEVLDIRKTVSPVVQPLEGTKLIYIDLSGDSKKLGGSSFAQILNLLGDEVPTIKDDSFFATAFDAMQQLIKSDLVLAGHDISEGGLITALLEMCFARPDTGLTLDLHGLGDDLIKILFSENPGVVFKPPKKMKFYLCSHNGVSRRKSWDTFQRTQNHRSLWNESHQIQY
jgi:phosphoribosylformylglycinamidine synthase